MTTRKVKTREWVGNQKSKGHFIKLTNERIGETVRQCEL
jgi:hypothetical protein